MPLISSSIGAATVLIKVSAEAPRYETVMVATGGAIWGYCATGSTLNASRPANTMISERTDAKMGRRTKNSQDIGVLYLAEGVTTTGRGTTGAPGRTF